MALILFSDLLVFLVNMAPTEEELEETSKFFKAEEWARMSFYEQSHWCSKLRNNKKMRELGKL